MQDQTTTILTPESAVLTPESLVRKGLLFSGVYHTPNQQVF